MNRHAPLFRVALLSLAMAVALPLLVFCAAQVRHRQLQSKANPRWSKFRDVNGVRTADQAPVAARPSPDNRNRSDQSAHVHSTRIPVHPASRMSGLTGSAAGSVQPDSTMPPAVPVDIPVEISRRDQAATPAPSAPVMPPLLAISTVPHNAAADAPRVASPKVASAATDLQVPNPDDLADDVPPAAAPRVTARPRIEFRTLDESPSADATSRLEAQLAGMQQRLDQLAQAQTERQTADLERALNLLRLSQLSQAPQIPDVRQSVPGNPAVPVPVPTDIPAPSSPPTVPPPAAKAVPGTGGPAGAASGREPSIKIVPGKLGDNDERFSIQVQEANLPEVLEMLGQLAGVNILTSREVQGKVSLNLQDVTVDRALDAILKSQGFVYEREGDFVYVRTMTEALALKQANRKLVTKVYQLHYVAASELQKLIDPVLTRGVGRQGVTTPAQSGIASIPTNAAGDGLAGRDTLLVQDYPEVIEEIDRIIIELDVPPLQVMIEAMILDVVLPDSMAFGVNFAMLNGAQNFQVLPGNGAIPNGAVGFPQAGCLSTSTGDCAAGLKCGFIQGDVNGFIKSLDVCADTTLVAAPQLRVLNKQKAEMIIGERLGYKTLAFHGNQTVENIQFLDAGTKLIFRPFISPDGLIRLEVHPERSKGKINAKTGLPNSETTEVTTNVMVRDGTTVVLGGMISEELTRSVDRVKFLGAIPVVGAAFRHKVEKVHRHELIILITPRIVTDPDGVIEGESPQFQQAGARHWPATPTPR